MIPYDPIEVVWSGEKLMARPIGWNVDIESDHINPEEAEDIFITKYELACPNCGSRCEFTFDSEQIWCKECESKTENPSFDVNKIDIDGSFDKDDIKELIDTCDGDDTDDMADTSVDEDTSNQEDSPGELFDSLEKSILNSEILLEPDEEDELEVKKSKKNTKKKTKKTKRKKKSKAKKKKTTKDNK